MNAEVTAGFKTSLLRRGVRRRIMDVLSLAAGEQVLRRRLQRGFLWNVIAAIFNQGSTFILGLVVANVLGRERFGMYALLQSTMLLFANIAQFAMGFTTTKFVAEFRSSNKPRAARIFAASLSTAAGAGVAGTVIAWSAASWIAAGILHHPDLAPLIRLGAPAIAFIVLGGVCSGALAGFENFRSIGLCGIVSGIVYIGAGVFAAMRWGVAGVVASIAVSSAIQAAILLALALREAKRQGVTPGLQAFREISLEAPLLTSFAFPAALAGFSSMPTLWIVSAVLARQANGMTEVALFTAANWIRLMVMFLPTLISGVGSSVLNNYRGLGDDAGYQKAFWVNFGAVALTAVAAMAAVMIASPLVMRSFGRDFVEGRGALIVIVAATLPEALGLAFFQIVQTRGRMWSSLLRIALPRDSSVVLSALLFVPRYGAVGACLAFLIGATVSLAGNLLLVRSLGISAR
jgi:O-antigen/teichoic acid export membrane protein